MLQRIKKLLEHNALAIAILTTIAIAFLSLSHLPKLDLGFKIKSSDKYLHTTAYFFLSLVWYFALRNRIKKTRFKILLIVALISYGIILEGLQGELTNYRTADFYDVIANSLGVLIATLVIDKILTWFRTI